MKLLLIWIGISERLVRLFWKEPDITDSEYIDEACKPDELPFM